MPSFWHNYSKDAAIKWAPLSATIVRGMLNAANNSRSCDTVLLDITWFTANSAGRCENKLKTSSRQRPANRPSHSNVIRRQTATTKFNRFHCVKFERPGRLAPSLSSIHPLTRCSTSESIWDSEIEFEAREARSHGREIWDTCCVPKADRETAKMVTLSVIRFDLGSTTKKSVLSSVEF